MEPTWTPPNFMANYNIQNNAVVNGIIERGQQNSTSSQPQASFAAPRSASNAQIVTRYSTIYTSQRSRTIANQAAIVNHARATDSAAADQLQQVLATSDVIGAVSGVMSSYGLNANDVSHAYAIYLLTYWSLANKYYEKPSERSVQAVARQSKEIFATNAEFGAMDNSAKQKAAEEFIIFAAILDAVLDQAKSNPALESQMVRAAIQKSRASGLGLDAIALTDEGFVPK
jgi:hypothetical protein